MPEWTPDDVPGRPSPRCDQAADHLPLRGLRMTDLFTNPHRFGDLDGWRSEAVDLHARGPIHRIEQPGYQPFWAVIGHDAILDIERRPADFTNGPAPVLGSDEQIAMRAAGGGQVRTLVNMDAPDHAKYRSLTTEWFKPASIRRMNDRLGPRRPLHRPVRRMPRTLATRIGARLRLRSQPGEAPTSCSRWAAVRSSTRPRSHNSQ